MCGKIDEAEKLFNEMPEQNVVSWNAMLAGYARYSLWGEALDLIVWMRQETSAVDQVTLGLILNVHAGFLNLKLGKELHGFIYSHVFTSNLFVGNALLDMYGNCGCLRNADLCFFQMGHQRDRISWNALIVAYARHRQNEEALKILYKIQSETNPNEFTFSTTFAACANVFTLDQGKEIHGYMIRHGFETDIVIKGVLVDMYSKCCHLEYSFKYFKEKGATDVILWSSMIFGCAHNGQDSNALELFELMQKEGIKENSVTILGVLLACISEGFLYLSQKVF